MSLRAEILRAGDALPVEGQARTGGRASRSAAGAPRPPNAWFPILRPSIKRIAVDAGGVAAEWVVAPVSQDDRHILYLHGGGYVIGSPSLYRHLTWRLAAAAQAPAAGDRLSAGAGAPVSGGARRRARGL